MIAAITLNTNALMILNVILAFVLFGIALELKPEDFKKLLINFKSSLVGLVSHFLLLPLITFLLVYLLQPPAEIALGMFMVGACPGGNMSNLFTHIAKGNTALAVGLTSVSHILAIFFTPFNFALYSSFYEPSASLLKEIKLSPFEVLSTVAGVIVIPLIAGMFLSIRKPEFAAKIQPHTRKISLAAFAFFLVAALISNFKNFSLYIGTIFPVVVLHNGLALLIGFLFANIMGLKKDDAKTISFETGIQNSGLGLLLIFSFFPGYNEMAVVAAIWGVWHLVSGGSLAWWWGRKY